MGNFTYPSNDLQNPGRILGLTGTLWTDFYGGRQLLEQRTQAAAESAEQAHQDVLEAADSLSRYTVPIFHTEHWHLFYAKQTEVDTTDAALWRFDDADLPPLNGSPTYFFDRPLEDNEYTFPMPDGLVDVDLITNRLEDPSRVLHKGIDFRIDVSRRAIIFRENPLTDDTISKRNVYAGGQVADVEAALWLFQSKWDWGHIYTHFGHIIGLELPSSQNYRDLVNAAWDAITGGTSLAELESMVSAMSGIPLVKQDGEVVEVIATDTEHLLVITDQQVYKFNTNATAQVAVGDVLRAGASLITGYQRIEFRRGSGYENLPALVLGRGLLANEFASELVFENRVYPLTVTGDAGSERVEFPVHGHPLDVAHFWNTVHERRLTYGQSLYQLLAAQPGGVPATINPLQFLVTHLLRNNAIAILLDVSSFTETALGLGPGRLVRKILPPHIALLLVLELPTFTDSVTMTDTAGELFDGMEPMTTAVSEIGVSNFTSRHVSFTCH